MGLQVTKSSDTQYNPVFLKILEDIPGGVTLQTSDLKSTTEELKAGAIIGEDGSTSGLYHLIKTAEVHADVTEGNDIQVEKGHEFKVGDFISNGNASSEITAIDTSNSDYDVITVTNGFACNDGDILYLSTSEGNDAADVAMKYTPSAITKDTVAVITYSASGKRTETNVNVAAVVRGTVNESLLPFKVHSNMKTALTDRIRFA